LSVFIMKTRILSVLWGLGSVAAFLGFVAPVAGQAIIVDHTCTRLDMVPATAVQRARETLHIAYGHTSHGSQLVYGMQALVGFMNAKKADAFPDNAFAFNSGGTGGVLDLRDTPFSGASDLGNPNRTAWSAATRSYLAAHPETNVIIWSWCGQVDGTEAEINSYLTQMNALERDFPTVRFVYMTGHLNGTGAAGNVNVRNNQIRAYCRANGKILYDFADIESYDPDGLVNYMERLANDNCDYDSDGNGSLDRNWATAWQASHTQNVDWFSCDAAHSQSLNGNRKAYAAWWLWARLGGWSGPVTDTSAPTVPAGVRATATATTSISLAWSASSDPESGVSGYRVYREGVDVGQVTQSAFVDTGLAPSTTYRYTVAAFNGAGLLSESSAPLAAATTADTEAPGVPAGLSAASASSRSNALNWTAATDNVRVTAYVIHRDGVAVANAASPGWTDSGLIAGRSYRYAVSARDAAGNESPRSAEVTRAPTPDPIVPGVSAPATLSAAGWFSDLVALTPAASLVAYDVVIPGWSDYALVTHWVRRASPTATFGFSPEGAWSAPAGTLWIQQFDIETVCGDPASRVRVETRVLLRTADGAVALSYRWNDAQSDATLVPEAGAGFDYVVCDGAANTTRRWTIPSRNQCLGCHNAVAGYALGFRTRQLNRAGPTGTGVGNQIAALAAAGWLDPAPPQPASLPAHPRLADTCVPLETRARAWLDASCSACHQPGGASGRAFDLRATTALAATGLVGGSVNNTLGDPAMRLVAPDFPEHSAVAVRLSLRGTNQMPAVGRSEVDPLGSRLVSEWVHRLAQPAGTPEAQLANLSTRGVVQGGDAVMIGGFVVSGTGARRMLLRGVGPELGRFGVGAVLGDPQIELFRGGTSLGGNDDWGASPDAAAIRSAAAACGAFSLAEGGRDAALLVTLEPGSYTVHVRGAAGLDAVGMFEAYDLTDGGTSRVVNLSTRVRLGSGERVAIPGLIVDGGTRRTFLLRAVGPGLVPRGVAGALADPRLAVMQADATLASNDDWGLPSGGSVLAQAAREVGAFALAAGSRDAALLITLDPGAYTVVTSGATGAEGIALVEVYEVL
jgi:chitodextrinase